VEAGADRVAVTEAFSQGGEGSLELADAVINVCPGTSQFKPLYPLELSLEDKIARIATQVYGADGVKYSEVFENNWPTMPREGIRTCQCVSRRLSIRCRTMPNVLDCRQVSCFLCEKSSWRQGPDLYW